MKYNRSDFSKMLNDIFLDDYFKEYNRLKFKNKNKVLYYISSAYRRWYYSSFVEGTIITPSVIFQKLSEHNGIFSAPSIKYGKYPAINDVSFVHYSYSPDNHPVVDDLKKFLNACIPSLDLNEDDSISKKYEDTLFNLVTIQDEYYLDFLLNVSIRLKLLKKMPSLYSNKVQTTDKSRTFFNESKQNLFDRIFDTAIELASINVSEIMPTHINIFKKDYFLSLLKKPVPTDFIFKNVYSSLGFNIDAFFNDLADADDFDAMGDTDIFGDLNNVMISSTYLLGILLDRYFFTPFGHYLKIISPFYFMPYQFGEDLRLIHDELKMGGDMSTLTWAPPSSYFLTSVGLSYLKIEPNSDNFLKMPDEVPVNELIHALKANALSDARLKMLPEDTIGNPLYEIKVKISNNKRIWFNIEIESDNTLHQLHGKLCDILFLDYDNDYSIYLDDSESPFMQYVSPFSKKKFKKADRVTLETLNLHENQRLTYVMPHGVSPFLTSADNGNGTRGGKDIAMRLDIELVTIKMSNPRVFYPITSKKSKTLTELEYDFNGDLPF